MLTTSTFGIVHIVCYLQLTRFVALTTCMTLSNHIYCWVLHYMMYTHIIELFCNIIARMALYFDAYNYLMDWGWPSHARALLLQVAIQIKIKS